ncbi:MAG: hypothetical protein LUH54_04745, partial [Firmicutes bacterium]|nr:hypothetical protein [Bacillota bacterium]
MTEIKASGITLEFDEESTKFTIITGDGAVWHWLDTPSLSAGGKLYSFTDAEKMNHEKVKNGVGVGIRSRYEGFGGADIRFETFSWIEESSGNVFFEWIPINEVPDCQ